VDSDRWQHVQDLLLRALELDPQERDPFVAEACSGDEALLRELTSLIRSHQETGLLDIFGRREPPPEEAAAELERLRRAVAGRYDVEREVGRGGMAVVYLAHDVRHDRAVALKVLRPAVSTFLGTQQFLREIRISAQLTHPHILPLFDSGEAEGLLYFVMPYINGESLRQRLDRVVRLALEEGLRIGREVADALQYAHQRGVVHRDIKPGNVLLEAGHAVVADFGISRAVDRAGDARLTRTGIAMGTPKYMSPEQMSGGGRVDPRSDLYSLGCVLFEVFTGRPPFLGDSLTSLVGQHLHAPPPPVTSLLPSLPTWIDDVLDRALAKDPAARFQTCAELAQALEQGSGPHVARAAPAARTEPDRAVLSRPAVAVLPFENLSADPEQEYFADGLAEDLITALSSSGWFPVIARNSSFSYKGQHIPARDLCRDLNARYIVDGSVRRDGDRVRVNTQLIDGRTGQSVWAQRYDRQLTDIFEIQDELSELISAAVEPEMGRSERTSVRSRAPDSLDAWESYQLGMWYLYRYTREDFESAREAFDRALQLDPSLVAGLVGIAETYYYDVVLGLTDDPAHCRREALRVAQRAVSLDGDDARTHCALGRAHVMRREHELAIPEFEAALERNPSLDRAHYGLGAAKVFVGRAREALPHLRVAIRLSPRDIYLGSFLVRTADAHFFMRDYEGALDWSRKALQQAGFQWSRYATLLASLGHLGRIEEAQGVLEELLTKRPDFTTGFVRRTHLFTHAPDMDHFLEGLRRAGVGTTERSSRRKLAAILSADVEGYSRLMGKDETGTIHTLTEYRGILSESIERRGGRVVDSPGDNLLAEFASAVQAVECAVEVQLALAERNRNRPPERRMEFRVGINIGDVVVAGDRLYGEGVNIAARLEALAKGGGICISDDVHRQVEGKLPLKFQDLGERSVKNIARPIRAYRAVLGEPEPEDEVSAVPPPKVRQEIRFCTSDDGVRIAYATSGSGPPLVKAANWLNHLEYDWDSPIWRHLLHELSRDNFLVRYDERGNGLSDWEVEDITFDAFVRDLATVVDAAGLDRFPLLGVSQGCAVSIAYAVQHPERVSKLVLFGGYTRGKSHRGTSAQQEADALRTLIRHGWGRQEPVFRQIFTSQFIPGGTPEQAEWFNELQRITASPENAARIRQVIDDIEVSDLAARVEAPTLVLHCRDEQAVPFEEGRRMAALIPNARFVALEGRNHLVFEDEPAWPRFMHEVRSFLA
jgi:serine/threonine protein kinase/class 3 adenylate cyclase/pimeloyl-ACP methyl ester carboxylesterase